MTSGPTAEAGERQGRPRDVSGITSFRRHDKQEAVVKHKAVSEDAVHSVCKGSEEGSVDEGSKGSDYSHGLPML